MAGYSRLKTQRVESVIEGEWFEVNPYLDIEANEAITEAADADTKAGRALAGFREEMARVIVAWSLIDDDGAPLPITPENTGYICNADRLEIHARVTDASRRRTPQEQVDFLPASTDGPRAAAPLRQPALVA